MTNMLHEYPELMPDQPEEKGLEAIESNVENMTDLELVNHCREHSTEHPLIAELSFRLNRYINLFKAVTQEHDK